MQNRGSVRGLVVSVLVAFAAAPASALFIVDSTVDAVDQTPGDGVCQTIVGECTLRAAVQEANALAGPDSIAVPAGTYVLSLGPDSGLPDAATGDLDLTDTVAIVGPGPGINVVIDGNFTTRVFERAAPVDVMLTRLAIRNGEASGNGGGMLVGGSGGMVTVEECLVTGNHAG